MKEYALLAFGICLIASLLLLFSYGRMGEKLAVSVISLFVLLSPLAKAASGFDIDSLFDFSEPKVEGSLSEYTEQSFAEGIALSVADKFLLKEKDISVRLTGFDVKNMRAEKIKITLHSAAVLADRGAIERYINEMEIGECSVEIDLG